MSKLKVYSGVTYVGLNERTTIVAATSKREAIASLAAHGEQISSYEFNENWYETLSNKLSGIALAKPRTVFRALPNGEFHEVEK